MLAIFLRLTLATNKVNPCQKILTREWQDDECDLSINIFAEAARGAPLKSQNDGKCQIQEKDDEYDCVYKTRGVSCAKCIKEVSDNHGPTEDMWNESQPVKVPTNRVVCVQSSCFSDSRARTQAQITWCRQWDRIGGIACANLGHRIGPHHLELSLWRRHWMHTHVDHWSGLDP
jgi:hypothetical protein